MSVPVNPNLPLSYVKPTIAVAIDTNASAGADAQEASTVLFFTEQLAAGTATLNTVTDLGSVTDASNAYGAKSIAVRSLRAALAQTNVAGAVTFKGVGVVEPVGGTAGIMQIVVSVPGTNPSAAGGCTLTMGGSESVSIGWGVTDTATTIGAALATALNTLQFEPWGTFSNSTGTVTATAVAKGAYVEEHAVRVVYSAQAGVYLGPGSLTLAGSPGADGSISLVAGAQTLTVAIDHLVQTSATLAAAHVAAALPTAAFPLLAGTPSGGAVPLYFAPGCDVRRPAAYITGVTTTTATLTGGSATDGTGVGATNPTHANVPGTKYPALGTALTNVRAAGSFGKWVGPWFDADPASAQFSAISTDGNGAPNQNRGQTLTLCGTGTESDTKALLAATSPAMNANAANNNNGMRGAVACMPDASQPGYILAAKIAAMRAASAPFTNYDGLPLTGTSDCPLPLPSPGAIAAFTDATQNQAIKDGLTPLGIVGGSLVVIFGRTTLATTDSALWDWSWIDQADDHRRDYRAQAAPTFAGCALIPSGSMPSSRKDVDPECINAFSRAMLRRWQAQGTYAGADALAAQCQAQINPTNAGRADAVYPESPKTPLHQIGVTAVRTSIPTA